MPQDAMSERQLRTVSRRKMRRPVVGHTPSLASVAATTATCWQVISIEQNIKYRSRVACKLVSGEMAFCSRCCFQSLSQTA